MRAEGVGLLNRGMTVRAIHTSVLSHYRHDQNMGIMGAMSQLTPCPNCHQHVRLSETQCPFCQATLRGLLPEPLPITPQTIYSVPAYGGPRLAPKYGGPPIIRAARLLLFVGGVGVTVYLIVHMVR